MAADLTSHHGDLEPDEDYESVLFDGATFADADAAHCHLLASPFLNLPFADGRRRRPGSPTSPCARPGSYPATWPKPAGKTSRWPAARWPGCRPSPPRCA